MRPSNTDDGESFCGTCDEPQFDANLIGLLQTKVQQLDQLTSDFIEAVSSDVSYIMVRFETNLKNVEDMIQEVSHKMITSHISPADKEDFASIKRDWLSSQHESHRMRLSRMMKKLEFSLVTT